MTFIGVLLHLRYEHAQMLLFLAESVFSVPESHSKCQLEFEVNSEEYFQYPEMGLEHSFSYFLTSPFASFNPTFGAAISIM